MQDNYRLIIKLFIVETVALLVLFVLNAAAQTVAYTYDELNRLTSATYDTVVINYVYDANGNITEVVTPVGCSDVYFRDADGDGYGDPNTSVQSCSLPTGFVTDNTDCNDDPVFGMYEHPGQTWYPDVDGDGYYSGVAVMDSCTRPPNHYAAEELVTIESVDNCPLTTNPDQSDYDSDGIGDICDAFFADNYYYLDTDQDGIADEWENIKFGNLTTATSSTDTDKDGILDIDEFKIDMDPTVNIHSGYVSQETYDQDMADMDEYSSYLLMGDYDLDGDVDAFDLSWFSLEFGKTEINIDNDGDGFSEIQGDCNDNDANINPDQSELCDSVDNNCNGIADEGCD